MKEVIFRQISFIMPYVIFSFVIIIIPLIVIILTSRSFKADLKVIERKIATYFGCTLVIIIGLLAFIPNLKLTINLLRDFNQTTVLTEEGYAYRKSSKVKLPVIEINNEQFILSSKIGSIETGEYCKIEYFKYSKYVYTIEKDKS